MGQACSEHEKVEYTDSGLILSDVEMPVACVEYAVRHLEGVCRGESHTACAAVGMAVRKSPNFPKGEDEAGRVCPGIGTVVSVGGAPDGLETITVFWPEAGDYTAWTRAGTAGFDVVTVTEEVDRTVVVCDSNP